MTQRSIFPLISGAIVALVAVVLLSTAGPVRGQSEPIECNVAESMMFNVTEMAGVWYEIARYPLPAESYLCVLVNLTMQPNMTLEVAITYSNTPSYPWVNQTMYTSIDEESTAGYNLSFWNPPNYTPPTVFKLLATDYNSYALVCGYSDPDDESTFFGVILMRDQDPDSDQLDQIEEEASVEYAQFPNSSMQLITQSTCEFVSDFAEPTLKPLGYSFGFLLALTLWTRQ